MKKSLCAIWLLILSYAMILAFGVVEPSSAASYCFDMGGNSWVDTSRTDTALHMDAVINPDLDDISFSLEVGQQYSFYFAKFYTTEGWINEDDLEPGTLTAHVDFDNPELVEAIGGTSIGFSCLWHFIQGWNLTWDDPKIVDFGDEGEFVIALSDVSYASWFWQGPDGCAKVYGTVTLNAAPIPIPGTALLLGSGVLGLMGFRFKRRTGHSRT